MMPNSASELTSANIASVQQDVAVAEANETFPAPKPASGAPTSTVLTLDSTLDSDLVSEDSDAGLWQDARPANAQVNDAASEGEAEFILVSDRSSTDGN